MNEIRQQSHQLSQAPGNRGYLQQVVDNALQQTERVCAIVKRFSDNHAEGAGGPDGRYDEASEGGRAKGRALAAGTIPALGAGQKPLTKRECEVLRYVSEGCSNKEGALRMNISPRTFESHRAEAMRKLGARNTADLVRKALLLSN
jgi:DNA-binding CsgD family transcriptional regulator